MDKLHLQLSPRVSPRSLLFADRTPPVDLLTASHSSAPTLINYEGFRLQLGVSNEADFHAYYDIHVQGGKLATVFFDRTKKYGYNKDRLTFRVENQAFYTLPFYNLVPLFLEAFNLERYSNTVLDIARDSDENTWAKLRDYLSQPDRYQLRKHKSNKEFRPLGTIDMVTGALADSYAFGDAKSKVMWRHYPKTVEVAASGKTYITASHLANGFAPGTEVRRDEVSIKAAALRNYRPRVVMADGTILSPYQYEQTESFYSNAAPKGQVESGKQAKPIELEQLGSQEYLAALFDHFFPIDLREKPTPKAKLCRCKRVTLFNENKYQKTKLSFPVNYAPVQSKGTAERRRLKENVLDFTRNEKVIYLEAAIDLAERHDLHEDLKQLLHKFRAVETISNLDYTPLLEGVVLKYGLATNAPFSEPAITMSPQKDNAPTFDLVTDLF